MRWPWLLVALPLTAQADLYRWIDPASGSVKYSSQPPSDPRIEPDVVRYKAPAPPKPPTEVAPEPSTRELVARWRGLAAQLAAIPPEELMSGSERVRRQAQAMEAARAELDRLDPAGAGRRGAELAAMMQRSVKRTP